MACGGHTAMRSLSGALRYRPSPEGAACHDPLGGQRRDGHSGRHSRGGEHGHPPDRPAPWSSLHQPGRGCGRGGPRRGPGGPAGFRVHPGRKVASSAARWSPAPSGGDPRAGPGAGTGTEADERVFARWPDRRSPRRAHAGLRGRGQVSRVRRPSGDHEAPSVRGCSRGLPPAGRERRTTRRTTRRISRRLERGAARRGPYGYRSTAARIPGRSVPGPGARRRLGTPAGPARPAAHVIPGADEARRGLPARRSRPAARSCPAARRLPAREPGCPAGLPARGDPGRPAAYPVPGGPAAAPRRGPAAGEPPA